MRTTDPAPEPVPEPQPANQQPEPPAADTQAASASATEAATESPEQLERLRALIALAHPDAVPELIQGDTLSDLLDSIPAAQAAWARVARAQDESRRLTIPAGSATRSTQHDAAALSPYAKIRAGIARD